MTAGTTTADHGEAAREILGFLAFSEALKRELRHSWLSDGRRESVAEHSWQMAVMALVVHPRLEHPVDLDRCLRMILVHDLVEAEVGDIPFFEESERKRRKAEREQAAMTRLRERLGAPVGPEVEALWLEFEARETLEAKFAKALDNLEVQVQHNLADLATWEEVEYDLVYTKMDRHCAHDAFLQALCTAVKDQAGKKLRAAGLDPEAIERKALAAVKG